MKIRNLHSWNVSVESAKKIQEELRTRIFANQTRIDTSKIKRISAVDVSYSNDRAKAVVCIFSFPDLKLLEKKVITKKVRFPYIPGFLSFREGPIILEAFKKIKLEPDLILFDGQGIMHPKRMGIATHLGIILNKPTIGCAKNYLWGEFKLPKEKRGSYSYIYDKKTKERIGAVLRTKDRIKPLFVSIGFKIDLDTSIKIILKITHKYRLPQPLRFVHHLTKIAKVKKFLGLNISHAS